MSPQTIATATPPPSFGASPEIPSRALYAGLASRECPETPTPSTRPLGSPVKRTIVRTISQLTDDRIDPTLLQVPKQLSESTSVSGNSNDGSSILDDISSEDEEEIPEHTVDATIIKKKSSEVPQKRKLTPDEVTFEPDNRKRDSYYRNVGNRLKENLIKLGNYTGCYGILLLARDVSP